MKRQIFLFLPDWVGLAIQSNRLHASIISQTINTSCLSFNMIVTYLMVGNKHREYLEWQSLFENCSCLSFCLAIQVKIDGQILSQVKIKGQSGGTLVCHLHIKCLMSHLMSRLKHKPSPFWLELVLPKDTRS